MKKRSRSSFFLCYELKIHLMFHTHDPRVLILKRNAQNLYQVETGIARSHRDGNFCPFCKSNEWKFPLYLIFSMVVSFKVLWLYFK